MNATTNTYDWFFAPTRIKADKYQEDTSAFADNTLKSRQAGMIAMGGFGQPGTGCKVDENTQLRWGMEGAHRQKGPKQLWARPFSTTPFLGGGEPQAVDDESGLIRSAPPRGRKENTTIMDHAIPNYYQPLISSKASAYTDVNHWIEQWTRGGDATRLVQTKRDGQ
jgi:hypothetical protein